MNQVSVKKERERDLPKIYLPAYIILLIVLFVLYVSLIFEAILMGLSCSRNRKNDLNSLFLMLLPPLPLYAGSFLAPPPPPPVLSLFQLI